MKNYKVLNVGGVNRIILDNFNIKMTKEAVRLTNSKISLESSGNITIENIRNTQKLIIFQLRLTHSVKSTVKHVNYIICPIEINKLYFIILAKNSHEKITPLMLIFFE